MASILILEFKQLRISGLWKWNILDVKPEECNNILHTIFFFSQEEFTLTFDQNIKNDNNFRCF